MSQRSRRKLKHQSRLSAAERAAQDARNAKVQQFQLALGYAIVALAVVGGFVQSFWPQVFGLQNSNPAVGFGLAALAGFRLYALRSELRRQAEETPKTAARLTS